MGFFSNMFGEGKTKISSQEWSDYAIKQLTSEEWDGVRKEFYRKSKEQIPKVMSIPEDIFIAELLGAQLELLSFVSVKTNKKIGFALYPAIIQYMNNLEPSIKEHVDEGYMNANKKVAAFGRRGISGCNAIATSFAERLELNAPSEFIDQLEEEFEALGLVWINDISQYKFT